MKREHPTGNERTSLRKSADGRMATEAAWLKSKKHLVRKQNRLDTHRPSHGRTWPHRVGDNFRFAGNWFLSGLFSTDDIGEVCAHETLSEKLLCSTLRGEHSGSGAAASYC